MRIKTCSCHFLPALHRGLICLAITLPAFHFQGHAQAINTEPDWQLGNTISIERSITTGQDIALQNPLTLDVAAGQSVHFSGALSANFRAYPGLIKDGSGRVELSGDNSQFHANSLLRAGTLHLSGRDPLGPDWQQLTVYRGTTLSYAAGAVIANTINLSDTLHGTPDAAQDAHAVRWHVAEGMAAHIGSLHGQSTIPLIKTGAGTLRFTGFADHPHSLFTITEGGIQLDGSFAGQVTVLDTAWLSGQGTAGRLHIQPGGELRPMGQLTVHDHLEFAPGSTLTLRAWNNGHSDRLYSLGTATLGGYVSILPQDPADTWTSGHDYLIVQADGGLGDSRFDSVSSALPYLDASLRYDTHQAILSLQPKTIVQNTLENPLASGWAASVRSMLLEDSRFIRDAVYKTGFSRSGFWAHAFHASGHRRAVSSVNADERHINGLLLGNNIALNPQWHAGWYAGGSIAHLQDQQRNNNPTHPSTRATSAHLGLQAHGRHSWGAVTLGAAYSRHRLQHQRSASTNQLSHPINSRYRGHTKQAFAKATFNLWESAAQTSKVQPFLHAAWVQYRDSGHTENGGPLAMHLEKARPAVLFTTLGLNARQQVNLPQGQAVLQGSLGWRHAHGDIKQTANQYFRDDVLRSRLQASGQPIRRQGWDLQLGLQAELGKTTQLGVQYAGYYAKGMQDHGINVGVRVVW